jgi:regulator of protease activity HflC (stomatin/prohibitin superfamily)
VQAEILVIQAKAVADSNLAKAQAEADAIRLTGEATAKAIEMRGRALAQNSNLVDLVKAERWDGKLPTTMPGATVPMINLK